jgi:hypothetical protein
MAITDRLAALAGTETGKVIDLAHSHFQQKVSQHGHQGRALVETIAEVCRRHPNVVGLFVGLTVEQLLLADQRHYEQKRIEQGTSDNSAQVPAASSSDALTVPELAPKAETGIAPHPAFSGLRAAPLDFSKINSVAIGFEVFAALTLLKFSNGIAKAFRRKNKNEIWFAPVAKVHLFSGSLAGYFIARSLKAKRVSAWRNAAIGLFGTDALKPLLKAPKRRRGER